MATTTYKPMNADEKSVIANEYRKRYPRDEKMVKHCVSSTSNYFTSDEGIIVEFDKPSIRTEFWFGESGYDYDEVHDAATAASNSKNHFISENMGRLPSYSAAWLDCNGIYHYPYIKRKFTGGCALGEIVFADCNGTGYVTGIDLASIGYRKLTDKEVERLKQAELRRNYLFMKRLKTYLKRYGLKNVSCRTYWIDR